MYCLCQPTDCIWEVDWHIKSNGWNEFTWVEGKERSDDKYNLVDRLNLAIFPVIPVSDCMQYALVLEAEMKEYIVTGKKGGNGKVEFNQKLGNALSQVGCNLELEKITKNSFGHEEFQLSLSKILSDGFKFKAVPVHIKSINNFDKISEQLNSSKEIKDIIKMDKAGLKYAVRCKIQS